jgi:hypothetical protein
MLRRRHEEGVEFEIAVQNVTLASSLRMTVSKDPLKTGGHGGSAPGSGKASMSTESGGGGARNGAKENRKWMMYYDTVIAVGTAPQVLYCNWVSLGIIH